MGIGEPESTAEQADLTLDDHHRGEVTRVGQRVAASSRSASRSRASSRLYEMYGRRLRRHQAPRPIALRRAAGPGLRPHHDQRLRGSGSTRSASSPSWRVPSGRTRSVPGHRLQASVSRRSAEGRAAERHPTRGGCAAERSAWSRHQAATGPTHRARRRTAAHHDGTRTPPVSARSVCRCLWAFSALTIEASRAIRRAACVFVSFST